MSVRETHTLYDLPCMWNLKNTNSLEKRMDWWLPEVKRGEGRESWGKGVMVVKSINLKKKKGYTNSEDVQTLFFWAPKSLQIVTATMKDCSHEGEGDNRG